jgi:hypothetical protein
LIKANVLVVTVVLEVVILRPLVNRFGHMELAGASCAPRGHLPEKSIH